MRTEAAYSNVLVRTPIGRVRQVCRELAKGDKTQVAIAAQYSMSKQQVTDIKRRYASFIREWRRQAEQPHYAQWIADLEARVAALQDEYELSRNSEYSEHYEHIRARVAILHEAAEQTGQLPGRGTTVIVPVQHVIVAGADITELLA